MDITEGFGNDHQDVDECHLRVLENKSRLKGSSSCASMGWGIHIGQDDNGYVHCDDANFETCDDDYDGFPPSSYDFICNYMDDNHHSEIDMARDEGSVELAHEYCSDAFSSAKSAYCRLDEDEKVKMHESWLEKTREEIDGCVVDTVAETDTLKEIEDYKKEYSKQIEIMEKKLKDLELELIHLKTPLLNLNTKLNNIQRPAVTKAQLEAFIEKELEIFVYSDIEDDEGS